MGFFLQNFPSSCILGQPPGSGLKFKMEIRKTQGDGGGRMVDGFNNNNNLKFKEINNDSI
jgi:hypothetical protein